MKIYIMLMLLLFTSCTSNNYMRTNKSLEVTVRNQEIEFKKLQEDNQKLREDIEILNKKIQKIEDFYELN